jgi:hypothetical protein
MGGATDDELFQEGFEALCDQGERSVREGLQPVLWRSGDDLHWVSGRDRRTWRVVGDEYHLARRIAHVPVALFLGAVRGSDPHALHGAMGVLGSCPSGLSVGAHHVSGELLSAMGDACRRFVAVGWGEGGPSHAATRALADGCRPAMNALVGAAAHHEVEALHAIVSGLRSEVSLLDWHCAYLVVVTGVQPRYKELSRCYFEALVDAEGHTRGGHRHRVLVLTGDHDEASVLERVGARQANRRVAELFTGSSDGLDQDVLGEAAQRAVKAVLSRGGAG